MDPPEIEDVYPLSATQEGMLFHSLVGRKSGMYLEQLTFRLNGFLDVAAFEQAWQRVVDRNPTLRTSFHWEGLENPHQVVWRRLAVGVETYDWRSRSVEDRARSLEAYLKRERDEGFPFDRAPLMRWTLIRTGEELWEFVWSSHHILLDAWSGSLVLKEAFEAYQALRAGVVLHKDPPRSYRTYITWLRRQDLSAAETFWRSELAGFTSATQLAPRGGDGSSDEPDAELEDVVQWVGRTTREGLQRFARKHHLTLNTLVQGAWAILLSRRSGTEDVVFGATTAGRPAELDGFESMVGLFVNTLPVRVRVRAEESLVPWLRNLQNRQAELRKHEHTPLVKIHEWSDVPRGQPLFESILVFENVPGSEVPLLDEAGDLRISDGRFLFRTNYLLTLVVIPGPELVLRAVAEPGRFGTGEVSLLLDRLRNLLEQIAADATHRLGELQILTEAERRILITEWNRTRTAVQGGRCIHETFEEQVCRGPDAVALAFEDEHLSYDALNRRANQLARVLRRRGVGPDTMVGICMDRSPDMAIGVLGILKAGGAYLPLDPAYPKDRLAFMLRDAGAPVLLTRKEMLHVLPEHAGVICLDEQRGAVAEEEETDCASGAAGDNLAYTIYTSGSTGLPKGVMLPHRALQNLIQWHLATLSRGARVLQFASLSFDASFHEMFAAWCGGGTLFMIPEGMRRDLEELAAFVASHSLDKLILPVVVLQEWAAHRDGSRLLRDARELITTGERLKLTRPVLELFRKLGDRCLHNHYGPSETHVVTACTLVPPAGDWPPFPPIGKPIANTEIYLVDCGLSPVPIGSPGEILIGGTSLARGYLFHPALTAERFIPDPFGERPGDRLYRSGDLGAYRPDGEIEFLGRRDGQVKVRGFRIEPGEIETALAGHEAVREAVVLPRDDPEGVQRLVAYWVPRGTRPATPGELRRFLEERLPDHMVPNAFVQVPALPLNPNGKLDRAKLPVPAWSGGEIEAGYVAPRTDVERGLADIWARVLNVPRVGVHDDFFQLGGHSLLAVRVHSRARETFGVHLALQSLFLGPTIAQLARRIEEAMIATGGPQQPEPQPLARVARRVAEPEDLPASTGPVDGAGEPS